MSKTSGSVAMARAMQRRCCWPPERERPLVVQLVLDLVPEGGAPQGIFNPLCLVALEAVQPQAEGHIAKDAHGKGIGLLEHHPDEAANGDGIDGGVIDIGALEIHLPFEAETSHEVVHAVEAAQHRAFAAPGRPDEGGDLSALYRDLGVAHRFKFTVVQLLNVAIDYHAVSV